MTEEKKTRYFEFRDGKSNKFWEMSWDGSRSFTVRYGKTGTDGRAITKSFASANEAKAAANKLMIAKHSKGYVYLPRQQPAEVGGSAVGETGSEIVGRLTTAQVAKRFFVGAGDKINRQLKELEALGKKTDDKLVTPYRTSASIVKTIKAIHRQGVPLLGPLLYSMTLERKPLLQMVFDRLELDPPERASVLSQLIKKGEPVLDLSRQALTSIPQEIGLVEVPGVEIGTKRARRQYREINLGYNDLPRLKARHFELLNRFEGIHLVGLKGRKLPSEVGLLTNAVMLNFSLCKIKTLPDELFGLTGLQDLRLNWTDIAALPERVHELRALRFIELSMTPLADLLYHLDEAQDEGAIVEHEALKTRDALLERGCQIDA